MQITNKTKWNNEDLRKILIAGIKANGMTIEDYIVNVRTFRGRGRNGFGWYYMKRFAICLPKAELYPIGMDEERLRELARVINHEIAHNRGLKHSEMDLSSFSGMEATQWIVGLQLHPSQAKPKVNHAERREKHSRKMLEQAERKLKTARRAHSRWAAKVRYYEQKRKAAASSSTSFTWKQL